MTGFLLALIFVVLLAIVGVVAYVATIYNSLVQVKHNVDQSWSNIDVLLKQRGDELGKLIDAVKGYLAYERDLLTRLTTLRSQVGRGGPDESRLAAEREIGVGVGRIFALAENYPDLKSSGNFLELQRRITALEEQIAHRREFYNDAVNINNSRMEQVPDRLLAGAAGLQRRPLFEATAEERADIDVSARLTGITAALLVGFLSLTGCTASPPDASDAPAVMVDAGGVPIPPSHAGPPRLLKPSELSEAEKRFGISPERTPGLTYQPDVVLLRAGVNAIRSLSDDGLVWTLDPRAEGIDGIQPGKVLLLSTKAAGRVLGVTRTNAGVEVVLGPADITEIVREGTFSIDQPVDLTQALQMNLPASFDPLRPVAPISANFRRPDREGFAIIPARFVSAAEEHDFRVIPMASVKGVGAELRSKPGGVLMVAQIVFRLEAPSLSVKLNIQPTGVVSALVELKGAAGIEASFEAAAPGPNARNINADRPAPVDLFIPINGLGIPFAVHVRQVFRVQTAFASTGTVKAHGFYELSGGIRAEYSSKKFTVKGPEGLGKKETLLPNLDGAAFGPVGIVFTHQVNIMVGVGVAGFVAGPYVYNNSSVTAAKGSALSRPLTPECRRETVSMAVGAGVGYRIPAIVAKVINSILNFFKITARINDSGGVSTDPVMLVNTGWYWPKMQACGS